MRDRSVRWCQCGRGGGGGEGLNMKRRVWKSKGRKGKGMDYEGRTSVEEERRGWR